ncbi:vWA domain-containing protein [Capnocytophaga leadbetteri]|uniref:vWA domain-containing protein n=1 Tax=Capnocytophaga leadbetteri TaxID=327575 RepID=UPI0028F089E8|nr:vWA domain-containing protein [Capnocytophaga leadbetteri]
MKKLYFLSFIAALLLSACARPDDGMHDDYSMHSKESKDGQGGIQPQGGLVTAGEWNDLDNWAFYQKTLMKEPFKGFPDDWQMYTNHRIAVALTAKNKPAANATVTLFRNDTPIWTAKTDNLGRAELWVGAFQKEKELNTALLRLKVNEQWVSTAAISETQVNRIALDETLPSPTNLVQIAFMVDATGSMGDELEFLKMDLKKVINEVQKTNNQLKISTATVFYRDEGDEYVVKHSPFTEDINQTTEFISQQRADGGGDFPEAVDKALVQLNQLQWQPEARTRIAFLVLDAPPHNKPAVISSIQYSVKTAAASGIKLIPVVASGIDKTTEFLMRFIAMYTNGTYVFITDHSGIGNKHLEPSVGEYQVEKLSDLMVRLIKKYSE